MATTQVALGFPSGLNGFVDTFTGLDNVSGRIGFWTRGDGVAAVLTERFRLTKAGNLVGITASGGIGYATGAGVAALLVA